MTVLPEAEILAGRTEAGGGGGGGGGEAWQQLLCADQAGGGPSPLPVKHCPSNSRKPAQADLWDHPLPPPPPLLPPLLPNSTASA